MNNTEFYTLITTHNLNDLQNIDNLLFVSMFSGFMSVNFPYLECRVTAFVTALFFTGSVIESNNLNRLSLIGGGENKCYINIDLKFKLAITNPR